MIAKTLTLIITCIAISFSCSKQKTIEIPLTQKDGYGCFHSYLGGISPYREYDENDSWKKTYLKVTGVPENWTEIKYGDIETDIYQSVYQNYLLGNISQDTYEELKKSWNWEPDTLILSKEPLKTKVAFAFGKDSTGTVRMIVDANNNLSFSDNESFIPYNVPLSGEVNRDSVAQSHAINVSYERFILNKKVITNAPLLIVYMSQMNMFMSNFAQHSVADFDGSQIAVCSDMFINLSYKNPSLALLNDSLKEGDKIGFDKLINKNEYVEIKGKLYKNLGVNLNNNTLVLERMNLPKNELNSTQIGFKAFPVAGNEFISASPVSLNQLRGKYVLLDFWAVWCGPCRMEIPNLKELYKKTNREKFEIIGIVGDSPTDALRELIGNDSITWPQIVSNDSVKIKESYGIHGYPTSFLIDPEGIIIAKDLRGKELEDKVLGLIK
jgi:thiol-disulfide isomerase/thioredoxin